MTRRYCRKRRWPFTTSYHTRFPEYVSARLPVPEDWCYGLQRRFHNGSAGTFVATPSLAADLKARRLRAADAVVARRRYRAVPAAKCAAVRRPAPCFSMSAASPWKRTSRRFSISTFPAARFWSAADLRLRAQAALSRCAIHRAAGRRGAGASLRLGRRVRVSEPDRHVRARAARGAGVRRSRGRLSGTGPDRRHHRSSGRACSNADLRAAALGALELDRRGGAGACTAL